MAEPDISTSADQRVIEASRKLQASLIDLIYAGDNIPCVVSDVRRRLQSDGEPFSDEFPGFIPTLDPPDFPDTPGFREYFDRVHTARTNGEEPDYAEFSREIGTKYKLPPNTLYQAFQRYCRQVKSIPAGADSDELKADYTRRKIGWPPVLDRLDRALVDLWAACSAAWNNWNGLNKAIGTGADLSPRLLGDLAGRPAEWLDHLSRFEELTPRTYRDVTGPAGVRELRNVSLHGILETLANDEDYPDLTEALEGLHHAERVLDPISRIPSVEPQGGDQKRDDSQLPQAGDENSQTEPTDTAEVELRKMAESVSSRRKKCFFRDHKWLSWQEAGETPPQIRDRWNSLSEEVTKEDRAGLLRQD